MNGDGLPPWPPPSHDPPPRFDPIRRKNASRIRDRGVVVAIYNFLDTLYG